MINVIRATWLDDEIGWCEYCCSTSSKKTYLPFHKGVRNPEHICGDCVIDLDFTIVDFYETSISYWKSLALHVDNPNKPLKTKKE